jgi:hypothetical protein
MLCSFYNHPELKMTLGDFFLAMRLRYLRTYMPQQRAMAGRAVTILKGEDS